MILELWISLLALSAAVLLYGWLTKEPSISFVGLTFLFILGIIMLFNQLEYETGMTIIQANSTAAVVTYNYTDFTGDYSRWFGLFLSFSSAAAAAMLLLNFKRDRE